MDYPLETLSQAQGEEGQLWLEAIHAGMMDIPSGFFLCFLLVNGKSMGNPWKNDDYWLVVWNMNFIFPYIGNNHPNWLIFFRGIETTNQFVFSVGERFFKTVHNFEIVKTYEQK